MKVKQVVVIALVLGLLAVCASTVRAIDQQGTLPMDISLTDDKPQSKLWYTDDGPTWWGIFGDGTSLFFYKLVISGSTSSFVKQTFPDALVHTDPLGRADVLWDGANLYVLVCTQATVAEAECLSTVTLSKYSYSAGTYTRVGRVDIPLTTGFETATIAKDSTGRLWIAYDPDTAIRVLWSTTNDMTWDPINAQMTVNQPTQPVDPDDMAAVVAFHNCLGATSNNCIGVMWDNQASDNIKFRIHRDEDPPGTWQTEELVAQGGLIADDHLSLKVTADGDILAATKASTEIPAGISADETNLFVRWHTTGLWQRFPITAGGTVPETASRPIAVFDSTHQDVYVFFTGRFDSDPRERTISYKVANVANLLELDNMAGTAAINIIGGAGTGLSINNATSTKQPVTLTTGLFVVAKGEDDSSTPTTGYYALLDLSPSTAPSIPTFSATPATVASGGPSTLSWTTTNTNATGVAITGGSTNLTNLPANGSTTVNPTATTTYTLTATGPGGTATQTVTVTVRVSAPPTIPTLSASPATVVSGGLSTLSWTTTNTNATGVAISGGSTNLTNLPANGSTTVNPTATTTYTLTATGPGGTATHTVTVTVTVSAPPTIPTFSATPAAVVSGGPSTLSWTTTNTNATGVAITGSTNLTNLPANGSTMVNPTATTTYTLTATGPGGTATRTVTVTVPPAGSTVTVETRIAASADDADQKSATGTADLGTGELDLGLLPNGLRFQLPIPQGATIVRAYVQFTVEDPSTGPTTLTIQGEASDNARPFKTGVKREITNRPRTASSVSWSVPGWPTRGAAGLDQQTQDLSTVLQEIVNRPGWVSGNWLALIITGNGHRQAWTFDGKRTMAPLLHVEYVQ
jgi:hypothetical protein